MGGWAKATRAACGIGAVLLFRLLWSVHLHGHHADPSARFGLDAGVGAQGLSRTRGHRRLLSDAEHQDRGLGKTTLNEVPVSDAKSAGAFGVTINDATFYGGIEIKTHEDVPESVCRLINPCIGWDGSILLQRWLERHDEVLKYQCRAQSVSFTMPDSEPPKDIKMIDLFGTKPMQYHMPNFLNDFLPGLVAIDLLFNRQGRAVSRSCLSRAGRQCSVFDDADIEVKKAAVVVDPRIRLVGEKNSWVHQLVRLAAPKSTSRIAPLYWSDLFPEGAASKPVCFRSATIAVPYERALQPSFVESLAMYAENGIQKQARTLDGPTRTARSGDDDSGAVPESPCSLNVTFLTRKIPDGQKDRLMARDIVNYPAVRKELTLMAERDGRVQLHVSDIKLEGRSLRWQINAMQKTDVLVAGHGAFLSNMIFLRSKSSVLEIQPFAYYPDIYERIASRYANVDYNTFVANPDKEAFSACMKHYFKPTNPKYEKAQKLVARFQSAAADYSRSPKNTHSLTIHNLDSSMSKVRLCAELQRLDTDPVRLAESIFAQAKATCARFESS